MQTPQNALRIGLLLILFPAAVSAQRQAQILKTGDPTRKAILNALRRPVEKELRQKVIFQVNLLRLQNGWAFLDGTPLQPNSKPIHFEKTKYQEAVEHGAFGGGMFALLHKQRGNWRVVAYRIGPTDVAWEGWDKQYHAPSTLFPYSLDASGTVHRH